MSSRLIVNSIRHTGASGDAVTLANDGTCTANITNRSNRNLIINGAMQVAQRGTSASYDTNGWHTLDRFQPSWGSIDNAITQEQAAVTSGGAYDAGFRNCFKITNGNQTGGAGAGSYITITYKTEAQDLANSGWKYTSASSYVTLSFWVKASVAQNYYFRFQTKDGSSYNYPMETGSLSADTWTKITKTIPGNSNLQIDNDNGEGPKIEWSMFKGTDHTASGVTLNQWAGYADGTHTPDQTSTWYTTNDATYEITGVQLEVGSVATDFEHRSYAQELQLCSRYYQQWAAITSGSSNDNSVAVLANFSSTHAYGRIPYLNGTMRTAPSIIQSTNAYFTNGASYTGLTYAIAGASLTAMEVSVSASSGNWTAGDAGWLRAQTGSGGQFALNAEL